MALGTDHLGRDQQVGARATAEVENGRSLVDATEHVRVRDPGEALHGRLGDVRELGLWIAEVFGPRTPGGEDEVLRGLG